MKDNDPGCGVRDLAPVAPIAWSGIADLLGDVDKMVFAVPNTVGNLSEGPTGLVQTARALRKVLGDHGIPFARDGGGDPFYVDVRTGTI